MTRILATLALCLLSGAASAADLVKGKLGARPVAVVRGVGHLLVDDEELARRKEGWQPLPPRYTTGVLGKYAKLVQSASTGAVCR